MNEYSARTKYDATRARRYREAAPRRRERENSVLRDWLAELAPTTVLDAPCGTARVVSLLPPQTKRYVGVDASKAMLHEGCDRLLTEGPNSVDVQFLRADLESLPFADGSVASTVCLRFLHHLPPASFEQVIAELARVTERWLLLSFFHPRSAHAWQRAVQTRLFGVKSDRHTHSPRRLRDALRARGFACRELRSTGFLRELWFARFERVAESDASRGPAQEPAP